MFHLIDVCQPLSSGALLLTIRAHKLNSHGSTDEGNAWRQQHGLFTQDAVAAVTTKCLMYQQQGSILGS